MNKVYTVIIKDRHHDELAYVFSNKELAIQAARNYIAAMHAKYGFPKDDHEEHEINDTCYPHLTFILWACAGTDAPSIAVMEAVIDSGFKELYR